MTDDADQPRADLAQTTIVSSPRQRVFRRLSWSGRLVELAWRWASRLLFYPSPNSAHTWRRWVLWCFGASVARCAKIHNSTRIIHPWNLTVGPGTTIKQRVILDCQAPVTIGANTQISQFTHLCTATHIYDQRDMPIVGRPIGIGDRCWLAADVFVGCGVKIADDVIVGARSSVFRDIPANTTVIGSPARKIHPSSQVPSAGTASGATTAS